MELNYYKVSKPTIWQKILLFCVSSIIAFLIIGGIMWYLSDYSERREKEILSNPAYTKGTIISKRSYKGKGADIEYFVNGKPYVLSRGISTEFHKKHKLWDEVEVIYSKENPGNSVLKEEIDSTK